MKIKLNLNDLVSCYACASKTAGEYMTLCSEKEAVIDRMKIYIMNKNYIGRSQFIDVDSMILVGINVDELKRFAMAKEHKEEEEEDNEN